MNTSSSNVRAGVSLRYWFQTWATIWGKEERGGRDEELVLVVLLGFEGVGVVSEDGMGALLREGGLGVEPRTEPDGVEVGFFAIVWVW
jgi:hypothetical protein